MRPFSRRSADAVESLRTASNTSKKEGEGNALSLLSFWEVRVNIEQEVIKTSIDKRKLYSVQLEVTTKCNWRCRHCYIPTHDNEGMSIESITKLFAELREMGVFELTLTGGEIFTRNDIHDIIKIAREKGFKVNLFTNVSMMTEKDIEMIHNMHVSLISCTIFSMNEKIHDYIARSQGALTKTLDNLKMIKRYQIPVEVKTIILNINYNEWGEVEKFCKRNGFQYNLDHEIYFKSNGDKAPADLRLTASQFEAACKELDQARGFEIKMHDKNEYVCEGIRNFLFINANGDVYPCEKFLKKVGNINDTTVRKIWEGSIELRRLQNMRWNELTDCAKCALEKYCIHCPGTAFLEDGDEYGKSSMACKKAAIRCTINGERL